MTTSLTDQLGAKLRAELIRPKGKDEHDGVLSDATAFNMAVSAQDDRTIRNLARKYGVKIPPKTSDEPKPKNGSGDMPVDSDEIAGKVLEGLKPYLATDKDGKPVKAASQADLEALSARVDKVDANFAYLGFTDKREDDGRPIFTENSWATYVTNRNTTDSGNTALANALKFGGVAAIIMVIFTIIMEIVFWHHTLDVAAAMTLGLGALGFVVGMAVGAIIPSRNN